jgi:class 3 adenylate cyclase
VAVGFELYTAIPEQQLCYSGLRTGYGHGGNPQLAAILAADVAGYSRLAAADEERTLARLRVLRSDLIESRVLAPRHCERLMVAVLGCGVLAHGLQERR